MERRGEEGRALQISEVSLLYFYSPDLTALSLSLSLSLSLNYATNNTSGISPACRLVKQGKRMGPSKALQSDSNYQDLEFLTEIKDEVLAVPSTGNTTSDQSELSVYLGMRRNSSFADYFEGDLSQNLLSRRHFSQSSSTKSGLISTLVNKIRADGQTRSKVEGDAMLGRNSEVNISK